MELRRRCESVIKDWCKSAENKALLVKGARQIGKTHLIRRCLHEEERDVFEINLIEFPDAVKVLQNAHTVDELIMGFSTLKPHNFQKGNAVIFIDEVQRYKEMVTKIKFLVGDGSFRYVLSGSLLGVELTNLSSAPVGYMTILDMYPLDFMEFLQIAKVGEDIIENLRESFLNRTPVMDVVNQKMLDLFNRYLVVGGMPEAVSRFADTSNVNDVMQIHKDINRLYKLDFTQYESEDKRLILTQIYDLIPSELLKQNRRFQITDLKKGLHFERVESSFLWLENAGVSLSAYFSIFTTIFLI